MPYTQAELQEKVTLGRDAIFRVAPIVGGVVPASATFKELCLSSEVTVGFEGRTITFANFCSGGDDVEIVVGETGKVELSEMQWIEDDEALVIMEDAARAHTPVAYEFLPAGAGVGKPVYRGSILVKSWEIKAAATGTVTVNSPQIAAGGMPEKGTLAA